jgi:hypothetical protein
MVQLPKLYCVATVRSLLYFLLFLGSDSEEIHYKYHLTVIHGKSEYSYKGPVISLMKSANEVRAISVYQWRNRFSGKPMRQEH